MMANPIFSLSKFSLGLAVSAALGLVLCFSYVSASHARIGGHWDEALIDEGTFDSEPKLDSSEDSGLEVNRQSDLCQHTEFCTALDNTRESINVTKESLEMSLQSTNNTVADLQTSLQPTNEKVEELQTSLQSTEDTVADLQTSLQPTNEKVADMMDKLRCKEGWKCFENSCYFFSTEELTWEEGRAVCQNMDSDYVKISTQGEFEFIQSTLGFFEYFWVGLNDLETEGTLKWISDGTLLPDQVASSWWYPDQPANDEGSDCVSMESETSTGLIVRYCYILYRYICEVPNRICLE